MAWRVTGWFKRRVPTSTAIPRSGSAPATPRPQSPQVIASRPQLPRGGVFVARPPKPPGGVRLLRPLVVASTARHAGRQLFVRPPLKPPAASANVVPIPTRFVGTRPLHRGQQWIGKLPRNPASTLVPRPQPARIVAPSARHAGRVVFARPPLKPPVVVSGGVPVRTLFLGVRPPHRGLVAFARRPINPKATTSLRPLQALLIRSDGRRPGLAITTRMPRTPVPPRLMPAKVLRSDFRHPGRQLFSRPPLKIPPASVPGPAPRRVWFGGGVRLPHRGLTLAFRFPPLDPPSVYNSVLDAVVAAIAALNLSGIQAVVKRKLPSAEETLDTLPIICVVPSEDPEKFEWSSYEGDVNVGYITQVVLIAAGNHQLVNGLPTMLNWRQAVRQVFGSRTLAAVSSIFDVQIEMETPIDREKVNQNYDYSGMGFTFWSAENRTGGN